MGTIVPPKCLVRLPYFEQAAVASAGAAYADYTFQLTRYVCSVVCLLCVASSIPTRRAQVTSLVVTRSGSCSTATTGCCLLVCLTLFRVRKVYVDLQAWNQVADSTVGVSQIVGSAVSVYSTAATSLIDVIESPFSAGFYANHFLHINRAGISVETNKYARKTTFDLDKIRPYLFGSGAQPEAIDLQAQMGASPAAFNIYFSVYSGSDAGLDNVTIPFSIYLSYEVELLDPVQIGSS